MAENAENHINSAWERGGRGGGADVAGLSYLACGGCTGPRGWGGGGWRGEVRPCTRCNLLTSSSVLCLFSSYLHSAVGVSFDIKEARGKPYTNNEVEQNSKIGAKKILVLAYL